MSASDSAMLLRMLEPAIRPVDVSRGTGTKPTPEAFENRSFEALLAEARGPGMDELETWPRQDAQAGQPVAEATKQPPDVLSPLNGLGTIENVTLRQLIAQHRDAADTTGA